MEESSNGKSDEIVQKVESLLLDEEKKEVVAEGDLKTGSESVREIVFDENSEFVNEISPPVVDTQVLEEVEEKTVNNSVVDEVFESIEEVPVHILEVQVPDDVDELDSNQIGEEISHSVDDANEVSAALINTVLEANEEQVLPSITQYLGDDTNGVSVDVTNVESEKEIEEATTKPLILQSVDDNTNGVSEVVEEVVLHDSDKNDGVSPVVTEVVSNEIDQEITLHSSEVNVEVPPDPEVVVLSNAIQETKLPDLEQKQITGESSGTAELGSNGKADETLPVSSENGALIETRECNNKPDQITESNEIKPIISLNRSIRPTTSWRNCCGLLDVLRRSDR